MKDPSLGWLTVRWDFLFVATGVAVYTGKLHWAIGWMLAVLVHELGHGLAAAWLGGGFSMTLQLGGAGSYLAKVRPAQTRIMVALAGPVFGLGCSALAIQGAPLAPSAVLGAYLGAFAYAGLLWSGFQLVPFPPLDGGLVLQTIVKPKVGSAVTAWHIAWVVGLSVVILLVSWNARLMEPMIWLSGMTLLLGRNEAGYIRHVDAYAAWEAQDYREVIARVQTGPGYLPKADKMALMVLGVSAALELEDDEVLAEMADRLPTGHPSMMQAADALLRRKKPLGARLAERAFDALDSEALDPETLGPDTWADLAFRLAVYEVEDLKPESALGLLERAVGFGFSVDRIQVEPAFDPIKTEPRFVRLT